MKVLETVVAALRSVKEDRDNLPSALQKIGEVAEIVKQCVKEAEDGDEEEAEAYLTDLLKDLEGEIAMALSRPDNYNKWGCHYLPSILRSHMLQQCTNFKDPGIQHYGGDVFRDVRDIADDRFNELPAPKPSNNVSYHRSFGGGGASINMSNYNNCAGPCFATGLVLMADGSMKQVAEVVAGDLLWGDCGAVEVECVVETRFTASQAVNLVDLGNGVLVTPWHPVRAGGWVFPVDLLPMAARHVPAVYSLLLKAGGVFTIGEWETVALGHGLEEGKAAHPFFGSRAKVEVSLAAIPGRSAGRVILTGYDCLDRGRDGLVSSLRVEAPGCEAERVPMIAA
jgi:hypothetical protein